MMTDKLNILLVDDEPGKLITYQAMLAQLGESLITAQSGLEALERLLKNDVALVLMDVNMTGMDGFEAARMIHQHPRFENIPIIFVSGSLLEEMDRLKGYEEGGAVDYVAIPVIAPLLRAKVRVFLDLHRKTRQLESLNTRMTKLQDEERRCIARELHDSVGQLLAAIKMNHAVVEAESRKLSSEAARHLAESTAMVEEVNREIRTISYLLHPPLLDEAGLGSALRWYVDGFAERSKIAAKLDIASDIERLPPDVELAIYRVVQECLTNVHRHAASPSVDVRVSLVGASVKVEIADAGKGVVLRNDLDFISSAHSGVGLGGMRERLRHLGGTIHLQSDGCGTRVTVVIPVAHADSVTLSPSCSAMR